MILCRFWLIWDGAARRGLARREGARRARRADAFQGLQMFRVQRRLLHRAHLHRPVLVCINDDFSEKWRISQYIFRNLQDLYSFAPLRIQNFRNNQSCLNQAYIFV